MHSDAHEAIESLTGRRPVQLRRAGGGDTATAYTVQFDDGTTAFAKTTGDMPGALSAEAASLTWLAAAQTVPVPSVYGHDDQWLIIEHVPADSPRPRAADELGRGLARLHASGAETPGCPPPGGPADAWIGLAPMRNVPVPDWPRFYAEHRIEPYLRRALDSGVLSSDDGKVIARVRDRIDELAGPEEPPARLHGDLWAGNVQWGEQAWLIDPAAHGGHRETDLAMLHLFGCPYLDRIVSAYQEVHPLADGWRDRIGLHQLFPLLVHAILFGRAYASQAVSAARSALR